MFNQKFQTNTFWVKQPLQGRSIYFIRNKYMAGGTVDASRQGGGYPQTVALIAAKSSTLSGIILFSSSLTSSLKT